MDRDLIRAHELQERRDRLLKLREVIVLAPEWRRGVVELDRSVGECPLAKVAAEDPWFHERGQGFYWGKVTNLARYANWTGGAACMAYFRLGKDDAHNLFNSCLGADGVSRDEVLGNIDLLLHDKPALAYRKEALSVGVVFRRADLASVTA